MCVATRVSAPGSALTLPAVIPCSPGQRRGRREEERHRQPMQVGRDLGARSCAYQPLPRARATELKRSPSHADPTSPCSA